MSKQDDSTLILEDDTYFPTSRQRGYFVTFFLQMKTMLARNYTLLKRSYLSTLAQSVFGPIAFILILYVLQKAVDSKNNTAVYHPDKYTLGYVDSCQGLDRADPCINIMYYPSSSDTDSIMRLFSQQNTQRAGFDNNNPLSIQYGGKFDLDVKTKISRKYGIVSVPSEDFIYNYSLNHPNTTTFGINFDVDRTNDVYKYQIWFNTTVQRNGTIPYNTRVLSLMRGIDEAIIGHSGNSVAKIDVDLKDWPSLPVGGSSESIIGTVGPMFFFSAQMIIFISFIITLVSEKEKRLRESMQLAGLKAEVYWLSWFLSYSVLCIICSLTIIAMGNILALSSFRNTNFVAMFLTLFIFNISMLGFGCMIVSIIGTSASAVLVSIYVFVIGLVIMGSLFTNPSFTYIWWGGSVSTTIRSVLSLLPFFNFGVLFVTISNMSAGTINSVTSVYIPGPGFKFADLNRAIPKNLIQSLDVGGDVPAVPFPGSFLVQMLINLLIFIILTFYFDNVVPNQFGVSQHLLFFIDPRYYLSFFESKKASSVEIENWINSLKTADQPLVGEDSDVTAERSAVRDPNIPYVLRIADLNKVFKKLNPFAKKFTAIQSTCLGIREGEILALLGQNGAGKSTTMNILSGVMPKSRGDALFYGTTLKNQRAIRSMLGICPQHDILFNELNAQEHVRLYGGLKGLSKLEIDNLIDKGLYAVRLHNVKNLQTRSYSGGMKRRLSVLIATIGSPRIAFFDEPTTGMDPVNRRHVWRYLENFKKGRVIILTSHSMEEADILSDRVAVMAHGKVVALGSSIRLKSRFGFGYKFSMIAKDKKSTVIVKDTIARKFPQGMLQDDSAGALIYHFSDQNTDVICDFVDWLEANQMDTSSDNDLKQSIPMPEPYLNQSGYDSQTHIKMPEPNYYDSEKDYATSTRLISTWGMSQTSLEEVFLKLIRENQQ
ncbi:hypothetical protein BB561_005858 [Smittium simulii]|uniref:ABC transporter domain-containing protein n=1 Tax=Smittium simulii TaxID=133385 RepID=A0A2T9Y7Y3_9FUNG|nr:hypothetical protein BB561_005858 [Smittium simulii]